MSLLRQLNTLGVLRTLDDALAQSLRRLDPDTPDAVLAAAALASLAVSQGHAGFDPTRPRQLTDADIDWPNADAWTQALQSSPWVATPDAPDEEAAAAPLAFEHGLLYLRRYREYERRLALRLRHIAAQPMPDADIASVAPLFQILFPNQVPNQPSFPRRRESMDAALASPALTQTSMDSRLRGNDGEAPPPDRQARAAALALRRALLLVTGGPGTGKTTTIARLLALRIAVARHAGHAPLRIALAAPTGRAAERMAESLRGAASKMAAAGVDADVLAALPTQASTLHRLLGTIPDSPRFRHHADNPLPYDCVVVDEASMVDLPLMCKLTEAVADGAQLILLGDPDQLPSVEAGDVLAAILAAAGTGDALAQEDAEALYPLLSASPVQAPDQPSPALPAARDQPSASPSQATDRRRSSPTETTDQRDPASPQAHDQPDSSQSQAHDQPGSSQSLARDQPGSSQSHAHDQPGSSQSLARDQPGSSPSLAREARRGGPGRGALPASNPLHNHRVHLTHGWRQADTLHLAPLAEAIRNGDANQALTLLRSNTLGGVHFHENTEDPLQARPDLLTHWRTLATLTDPAEALRQANRLRLLTALREGPQGARGLNARIEAALSGRRLGTPPAWFPGRLLLVTENNYRHGLFNGDVGICLPDDDGTPLVWFAGNGGGNSADAGTGDVRPFHPAALPAHESAFATTVHKAQGSEFDTVWLQLPRADARVLSRELLYTGLTRARSVLHLAGSAEVIEAALSRHASRVSGLGWRLDPR